MTTKTVLRALPHATTSTAGMIPMPCEFLILQCDDQTQLRGTIVDGAISEREAESKLTAWKSANPTHEFFVLRTMKRAERTTRPWIVRDIAFGPRPVA